MLSAVTALLISFLVTSLVTPLVRRWALSRGIVDAPGGRRVHAQVTPRLGGVGLFVGFFLPLAAFSLWGTVAMGSFLEHPNRILGLVLGATIVALVGVVDDMNGLGAWPKLLAQAAAATVAFYAGFRIEAVDIPGLGELAMGPLAYFITLFWFLGIINALNLIDGLDGLAAGIALFASLANFVISFFNGVPVVAMLSASLAGALLGFLRYNFNPARIFMGDSGSMFLGFVLAATSIQGSTTKSSTAVAILAPMVALGVPIFDTLLAMVRRTLARQPIFSADRGHIHHRLLDLGLTHRRVVLVLYVGSIWLALAAIGIAFGRSWQLGGSLLMAGAGLFWLVRSAGLMSPPEAQRALAMRRRLKTVLSELSVAANEDAVHNSLRPLGNAMRLVALTSRGADSFSDGAREAEWIAHPISAGARAFRLELRRLDFEGMHEDLSPLLSKLVENCREALERANARERSTQVRIASASVSGVRD